MQRTNPSALCNPMREISLNIMDLAQNAIKVEAPFIEIDVTISEKENFISFFIKDNGCGMSEETLKKATDPFYTSRTSRRVGLGIPFCKLACEQAGGKFLLKSQLNVGTELCASYQYDHIDRQPMGDLASAILFTATASEKSDVSFHYTTDDSQFSFDTREIRAVLEGVPLNNPDVYQYLQEMLREGTK